MIVEWMAPWWAFPVLSPLIVLASSLATRVVLKHLPCRHADARLRTVGPLRFVQCRCGEVL